MTISLVEVLGHTQFSGRFFTRGHSPPWPVAAYLAIIIVHGLHQSSRPPNSILFDLHLKLKKEKNEERTCDNLAI